MKPCCKMYADLGLNYCGMCEPLVRDGERAVTVGRKKRKRKKGAGTGVKVAAHTRSPRGPNGGKKRVRVDGYARGGTKRKPKRKK